MTVTPWLSDPDVDIYVGDALEVLRGLPDGSVDCCVTSPPYWGLRDYGTGAWAGGSTDCDHKQTVARHDGGRVNVQGFHGSAATDSDKGAMNFRDVCGKCGAQRVDRQLGLEPTPDLYVAAMVAVFAEVRRVLADHGTLWLNIGDSYASGEVGRHDRSDEYEGEFQRPSRQGERKQVRLRSGLKPKDLCGIPWRLAFALQQPHYTGTIKDERDRIWLAATVEAEGCLFIHKRKAGQSNGQGYERKNASYGAGLEVASTDRVIVERCMEITGVGSICEQTPEQSTRRKQTIYRWNVRSNECRWIIRELYPHFLAKQHEARLLLGCPSSGDDASKAHESLKSIHQGGTPTIDFKPPASMFEPGWYLRSDIVWSKANPMPESVTDRPTKAHEYVFLLSKRPSYWFDAEAVREPHKEPWRGNGEVERNNWSAGGTAESRGSHDTVRLYNPAGRNVRSVWDIATQPYPEAHFATFPEELPRRAILAGCPEWVCGVCGKARERIVERERPSTRDARVEKLARIQTERGYPNSGTGTNSTTFGIAAADLPAPVTVGWSDCRCSGGGNHHEPLASAKPHAILPPAVGSNDAQDVRDEHGKDVTAGRDRQHYRPGIVLDPFLGSGTTAHVARKHGRRCVGIELNETYAQLAARRLQQLSLLAEGGYA